jgi:predicted aminopeptidase
MRRRQAAGIGMAVIITFLFSGCYLLGQGVTFIGDRAAARPIDQAAADSRTPEKVVEMFDRTRDIRSFADRELGLETSENYTTYVDLKRDHLAYIVYAAEELSFTQRTWTFPITGEIPYKGYYRLTTARREESRLQERGYDTWISVVDGFSSLGFFTDPLYPFMADYSPYRLSDLIIHEMVHATVWVKHSSSFNEQLASFIGEHGAKAYVRSQFGEDSPEYLSISEIEHDQQQFLSLLLDLRSSLEEIYENQDLSDDRKRRLKKETIEAFRTDFASSYDERFLTDRYRHIAEAEINNAFIALYGVYYSASGLLDRLYAHYDHNLAAMIAALVPLDGSKADPRSFVEQLLAQ